MLKNTIYSVDFGSSLCKDSSVKAADAERHGAFLLASLVELIFYQRQIAVSQQRLICVATRLECAMVMVRPHLAARYAIIMKTIDVQNSRSMDGWQVDEQALNTRCMNSA